MLQHFHIAPNLQVGKPRLSSCIKNSHLIRLLVVLEHLLVALVVNIKLSRLFSKFPKLKLVLVQSMNRKRNISLCQSSK